MHGPPMHFQPLSKKDLSQLRGGLDGFNHSFPLVTVCVSRGNSFVVAGVGRAGVSPKNEAFQSQKTRGSKNNLLLKP